MEPLKNDEMQGDEENLTELYCLYSEGRGDKVDAAVRVFQRFLLVVTCWAHLHAIDNYFPV